MQVAGSDWKLTEEGKSPEQGAEQPRWSTWDDVFAKRRPDGAAAGAAAPPESSSASGVYDDTFYRCHCDFEFGESFTDVSRIANATVL